MTNLQGGRCVNSCMRSGQNLDVSISTIKRARQNIEVLSTCQSRKYGKETKLVQTANFSKRNI